MKLPEAWDEDVKIAASGQRVMDQFGNPVKPANVLLFRSTGLYWRHKDLISAGATWDHDDYQPHITLSYETDLRNVKPWQGVIQLGPERWEEVDSTKVFIEDMQGAWK